MFSFYYLNNNYFYFWNNGTEIKPSKKYLDSLLNNSSLWTILNNFNPSYENDLTFSAIVPNDFRAKLIKVINNNFARYYYLVSQEQLNKDNKKVIFELDIWTTFYIPIYNTKFSFERLPYINNNYIYLNDDFINSVKLTTHYKTFEQIYNPTINNNNFVFSNLGGDLIFNLDDKDKLNNITEFFIIKEKEYLELIPLINVKGTYNYNEIIEHQPNNFGYVKLNVRGVIYEDRINQVDPLIYIVKELRKQGYRIWFNGFFDWKENKNIFNDILNFDFDAWKKYKTDITTIIDKLKPTDNTSFEVYLNSGKSSGSGSQGGVRSSTILKIKLNGTEKTIYSEHHYTQLNKYDFKKWYSKINQHTYIAQKNINNEEFDNRYEIIKKYIYKPEKVNNFLGLYQLPNLINMLNNCLIEDGLLKIRYDGVSQLCSVNFVPKEYNNYPNIDINFFGENFLINGVSNFWFNNRLIIQNNNGVYECDNRLPFYSDSYYNLIGESYNSVNAGVQVAKNNLAMGLAGGVSSIIGGLASFVNPVSSLTNILGGGAIFGGAFSLIKSGLQFKNQMNQLKAEWADKKNNNKGQINTANTNIIAYNNFNKKNYQYDYYIYKDDLDYLANLFNRFGYLHPNTITKIDVNGYYKISSLYNNLNNIIANNEYVIYIYELLKNGVFISDGIF